MPSKQTIADIKLAGGILCLDFVNTTGNRHKDVRRERLLDLSCWKIFLERTNLFGEEGIKRLRDDVTFESLTLAQIITFRENLFRLFMSCIRNESPLKKDINLFEDHIENMHKSRELIWNKGKICYQWRENINSSNLAISIITRSALKMFTSSSIDYVKKCGECDWLFLDSSKNKNRQWCRKTCGDRVKSRRYYAKKLKE